jgi:hypothetical protein
MEIRETHAANGVISNGLKPAL